jgi:hypothetical protein
LEGCVRCTLRNRGNDMLEVLVGFDFQRRFPRRSNLYLFPIRTGLDAISGEEILHEGILGMVVWIQAIACISHWWLRPRPLHYYSCYCTILSFHDVYSIGSVPHSINRAFYQFRTLSMLSWYEGIKFRP